jgi:agmatinase
MQADRPAGWSDPAKLNIADVGDFASAHGDLQATLALIEEQGERCRPPGFAWRRSHSDLALLRALKPGTGHLALAHVDTQQF